MRNIFLFFVVVIVLYSNHFPQNPLFKEPLSERIANYNISVELDTAEHLVKGTEVLYWRNTSSDIITELQFHLYLNAFSSDKTTFMKESGGIHRGYVKKEKIWGWTKIHSLKIVDGDDLTDSIEFYQPNDFNKDDKSVIRVPLKKPLTPNEKLSLKIEFTSKLPNIFARTGYTKDYYLVAQWFPKIGVYEKAGQRYSEKGNWNCHQFHAKSEFYANFGVYNVELVVPQNYVVGATGQLEYEKYNDDGTKYLLYHAEDVIDFAWTASPDFLVLEKKIENVKVKLLVQPQHHYLANRFFHSTEASIKYLNRYVGKYPYPNLTIVDPPIYGRGSGGMEYPTFFTSFAFWGLPKNARMLEVTTVHEYIHNYFMGILASNEFEEPWLDEGFTQYFETRIMDETYGENSSVLDILGYRMGSFESVRHGYARMPNPTVSDNSPFAWEYPPGSYGVLTYDKTATWLKTLENLIGRKIMDEVFQLYFEKWKFKHPSGKDFVNIVNEVVTENYGERFGKNMDWFFEQVLYGSEICDYKIDYVKNSIADINNEKVNKGPNRTKLLIDSEIMVYRVGEVKLPVEVLIHFEDGNEILEEWDGKERFKKYNYTSPNKVLWAKVDPNYKIKLDMNVQNNSFAVSPDNTVIYKYAAKVLYWVENLMLSFGMLF